MQTWKSDEKDVRFDEDITKQIVKFIDSYNALTVAMTHQILGCPHQEGIDYPEGESCPQCPYWVGKDRWAGVIKE
jgi:hypothetical protein